MPCVGIIRIECTGGSELMEAVHQVVGQWAWLLSIMAVWVVALSMMGAHGVFFADRVIEEDAPEPTH